MTFQVGDWVLWWGEIGQVIEYTNSAALIKLDIGLRNVAPKILEQHQVSWYKNAYDFWQPDRVQE